MKIQRERPLYDQIYEAVRRIPSGKVSTYGRVADIVGTCSAQMVGFALAALPEGSDVPWQRVINRFGKISPHGHGFGTIEQKTLLEEEGVRFDSNEVVSMEEFGWY
jgi:methylated-DNA-protein-cysteine methyltransferase-like protein